MKPSSLNLLAVIAATLVLPQTNCKPRAPPDQPGVAAAGESDAVILDIEHTTRSARTRCTSMEWLAVSGPPDRVENIQWIAIGLCDESERPEFAACYALSPAGQSPADEEETITLNDLPRGKMCSFSSVPERGVMVMKVDCCANR